MINKEEISLIEKCLDGSLRHQKRLYDKYSPMAWGISLRYAKNHDDAEDILQNTFVTVFTKLDTFNQKGALGAWIRKITINTALMHYRSNKKHQMYVELDDGGFNLESEETILSSIGVEELMNVIGNLPDGYRMVFNLYGIEGYSHKEIAAQLSITESTSRSQYTRARKILAQSIQEERRKANEQIS